MARIRTHKPEFFRHEGLQDLERDHPGMNAMLVFIGLWGHCDKGGKFEWRPRMLKLDILPFLEFSMDETLDLLHTAGFLERYEVEGKEYGRIPSFKDHQRIGGKEAQEPDRFPDPSPGSIREATGKQQGLQEGKGREGNRKGTEVAPAKADAPTNPVWFAYATAYEARYESPPVRNAKVNGQLKTLLSRLGADEAPSVAAFYVGHPSAYYVTRGHSLDCLVADAEKLRTEWATNRTITGNQARQQERTADNPFARMVGQNQKAIAHES